MKFVKILEDRAINGVFGRMLLVDLFFTYNFIGFVFVLLV